MNFRGRHIDPIRLWREFCPEIQDEDGPFLNLTFCPNPEHDNSRTPAFQINVHEPMVHCFRHCGISGSYEHAVAIVLGLYEKHKISPNADKSAKRKVYKDARREILRRAKVAGKKATRETAQVDSRGRGIHVPGRKRVTQITDREIHDYSYLPPLATGYLNSRGISAYGITRFGIGWDMAEKRIVIPVQDGRGRYVGLIRRAIRPQDQPKYLYSEGFDRNSLLFGARQLDLGLVKSQGLVLVEGSVDAICMHEHRLGNTGAILGSHVSEKQAEIIAGLHPPRIYLMFDKDSAGIWAILSARKAFRKFPLYVCRFPRGKDDPAELSRGEAYASLERALPWLKFKRLLPKSMTERSISVG